MPTPMPSCTTATVSADAATYLGLSAQFVGTIIGAIVALASVMWLFSKQQEAARLAARQQAQDHAFTRLMENFAAIAEATEAGDLAAQKVALGRFTGRTMEAVWFIDTREEYVADWVVTQIEKMIDEINAEPEVKKWGMIARKSSNSVGIVLRHWRYGTLPTSNIDGFVAELSEGKFDPGKR